MQLTVYIASMLVVIGIVASISMFFNKNMKTVENNTRYAGEFNKFNAAFVSDVKSNKQVKVDDQAKTIIFEDGTTYKYNVQDKGIYVGDKKIAGHVTYFSVGQRTVIINNLEKQIVTIQIGIGDSSKRMISKTIDYTLKYW